MKHIERSVSAACRRLAAAWLSDPRLRSAGLALGTFPTRLRGLGRPILGVVFLVLGVAGLFLPILQGVLFLFIGLSLLAPYSPCLQRQKDRLERRFPRLAEGERRIKARLKDLTARLGAHFRRQS